MIKPSVLDLARIAVEGTLKSGSLALDATVGNGHDTAFLAGLVGESGLVVGLDVQADALDAAKARIARLGLTDRMCLLETGHERTADALEPYLERPFVAAMFNLGYLPGSKKVVTTQPASTVVALRQVSRLLAPGGVVTVVAYTGHSGGKVEAQAVYDWGQHLSSAEFEVVHYRFLNRRRSAPELSIVRKSRRGC